MAGYGNMEAAKAGLIYGLDYEIESKVVPSGVTFDFGDPVFIDEGSEEVVAKADSNDASLNFFGIAIVSQRSFDDAQGDYPAYDTINVMTRGKVWVPTVSGVSAIANKPAYVGNVIATTAAYEKWTDSNSATYDAGCFFRTNADGVGGLAVIEVRGVK